VRGVTAICNWINGGDRVKAISGSGSGDGTGNCVRTIAERRAAPGDRSGDRINIGENNEAAAAASADGHLSVSVIVRVCVSLFVCLCVFVSMQSAAQQVG